MKKKILISIGFILLLLVALNPTNNDFKSFIDGNPADMRDRINYGRTSYFAIFSIYQSHIVRYSAKNEDNTYIGIFKNFILLP